MVGSMEPGWVTPEKVAEVMLGLVEKEEWIGGTVVEVGKTVREVGMFDDPGPRSVGNGVDNDEGFVDELWEELRGLLPA